MWWRAGILVIVCVIAAVVIGRTILTGRSGPAAAAKPGSIGAVPVQGIAGESDLLIRSTSLDRDYGRLGIVKESDPAGPRMLSTLQCDRADFEGGVGLCLARATTFLGTTRALVFDSHFRVLHTTQLTGYPSRARVSPNGHLGAITTFVGGDSYATMGQFSTRTDIIDIATGKVLFDLEKLSVTRDGRPFREVDFNFWGVTFAGDGRTFYATLGTGGVGYLIKGDIKTQKAVVLRSGVECPSLSPDGTRIAFKSRNPGAVATWRVSVLDLATLVSHPLAETRDVDDQPAWLNNSTVMYGLLHDASALNIENQSQPGLPALTTGGSIPTDTWKVPADGSGRPQLLVPGAWSTTAARS
jgi:hypothetical protein